MAETSGVSLLAAWPPPSPRYLRQLAGFRSRGFFPLHPLGFLGFQHLCLISLGKFVAITLSEITFPSLSPFVLELRHSVFRISHPFLHFLDHMYSFLFLTYISSLVYFFKHSKHSCFISGFGNSGSKGVGLLSCGPLCLRLLVMGPVSFV